MTNYDTASPLVDKHLAPDGSMSTSAGVSVAPADEVWAQRYVQASPIADKWLNPDGTITAGNAGGGGAEQVYPPAGIAVSTGTSWSPSVAFATNLAAGYLLTSGGPGVITYSNVMSAPLSSNLTVPGNLTAGTITSASIPQVIQSADEATAISDSTANPHNIYFWVEE
jgi:hypothetical protein